MDAKKPEDIDYFYSSFDEDRAVFIPSFGQQPTLLSSIKGIVYLTLWFLNSFLYFDIIDVDLADNSGNIGEHIDRVDIVLGHRVMGTEGVDERTEHNRPDEHQY